MSDDNGDGSVEHLGELVASGWEASRVVRPGDVLVVSTVDRGPTELAELKRLLVERFPNLADVVVVDQLRFEFVYRQDDEP